MPRVLLVAATTGYQVRSFAGAARRLGVDLVLATDRCHVLDDPWSDEAVPIRFDNEAASVQAIVEAVGGVVDGIVAVGDRPAEIAASAAAGLGLRLSPPEAVRAAGNKLLTRRRMSAAGLAHPPFMAVGGDDPVSVIADRIGLPCVVKPLAMSASRGVVRADTVEALETAVALARGLLPRHGVDAGNSAILAEEYIPGQEIAVEGLLTQGSLQVLAIFDKPDPLEGPFFEETVYVTPAVLTDARRQQITETVSRMVDALGLTDGPIHAECRLNDDGVFVVEIAARPIGGLCSKALRFRSADGHEASLEEVLLRHAVGESVTEYRREDAAAGVMMIPIPGAGRFRGVEGLGAAGAVAGIEDIVLTAKRDQQLQPLPEGRSYLGFIFARSATPRGVVGALREAHAHLRLDIAPVVPISAAESTDRE